MYFICTYRASFVICSESVLNMPRTRTVLSGSSFEIKERWFKQAASPLLRAVNMMISDSFSFDEIEPSSKLYNADKAAEYDKSKRRAQNFLYEQRNVVNDKWLPRYTIRRIRPGEETTEASQEMVNLLIDGTLDRLYENLIAYAPLFVAKDYVEPLQSSLKRVYDSESAKFRSYLQNFVAEYADGVLPLAQEYE